MFYIIVVCAGVCSHYGMFCIIPIQANDSEFNYLFYLGTEERPFPRTWQSNIFPHPIWISAAWAVPCYQLILLTTASSILSLQLHYGRTNYKFYYMPVFPRPFVGIPQTLCWNSPDPSLEWTGWQCQTNKPLLFSAPIECAR